MSTRTCGSRLAGALLACSAALAVAEPVAWQAGLRLLMFETTDCSYCVQWEHEVGVIYARTEEGRAAPLTRTPFAGGEPAGIELREPVRFAPTFVLVRDGREVGRITGYTGEANFWGLLGELLQRNKNG